MKRLWKPLTAEFLGTAILVLVGVSFVILDFGQGSPVPALIPSADARRLITGFLFGMTGMFITLSPIGKISGAHINPVVSVAFWAVGKLHPRHALANVIAQCLGGLVGALPLLLWGTIGRSADFGATLVGPGYGAGTAVVGEVVTTSALIGGLFVFISHQRLRRFTPALFPILYSLLVYLEAPISGTSTNPARSLGPMVIAGTWEGWWIYWVGPILGMLLGVGLHRISWLRYFEIKVAKVFYFEHDPARIFTPRKRLPPTGGRADGGKSHG
jgi:aquaporin Z